MRRVTDTFIYLPGIYLRKVWIWIVPKVRKHKKSYYAKLIHIIVLLPFQEYIPLCVRDQSYTGTDIVLI